MSGKHFYIYIIKCLNSDVLKISLYLFSICQALESSAPWGYIITINSRTFTCFRYLQHSSYQDNHIQHIMKLSVSIRTSSLILPYLYLMFFSFALLFFLFLPSPFTMLRRMIQIGYWKTSSELINVPFLERQLPVNDVSNKSYYFYIVAFLKRDCFPSFAETFIIVSFNQ